MHGPTILDIRRRYRDRGAVSGEGIKSESADAARAGLHVRDDNGRPAGAVLHDPGPLRGRTAPNPLDDPLGLAVGLRGRADGPDGTLVRAVGFRRRRGG